MYLPFVDLGDAMFVQIMYLLLKSFTRVFTTLSFKNPLRSASVKSLFLSSTLVFLITDQVPNNHPGYQNSGISGEMGLLFIYSY